MSHRRTTSLRVLLAAGLLSLLAACSTTPVPGSPERAGDGTPRAVQETAVVSADQFCPSTDPVGASEEAAESVAATGPAVSQDGLFATYKIGPGDILLFRSFDDESLSTQLAVRYDGNISPPLVADINVNGLTREEATEKVCAAYAAFYEDPLISLTVAESRSKKFAVMGDVARPADYPYTQPITLLESINVAGGPRVSQMTREPIIGEQGQLAKAFLIRHVGSERQVFEYNLRSLSTPGTHASDTPVLPGDIVYVPQCVNLVYVLGAVRSPGVYPMTEGLTVLQVLARSGSFDEVTGRIKQTVLMRQQDDKSAQVMLVNVRDIIKSGQDMPLKPGDILYVPRKPLANLQSFIAQVTGVVSPVMGLYRDAYNTYYTKDLFEQSLDSGQNRANDLLTLQQNVSDISRMLSGSLVAAPTGK